MSGRILNLKIVFTGDEGVGKTSIRNAYLGDKSRKNYLPTIGADFSNKLIELNNSTISVALWDIEEFKDHDDTFAQYFRHADAAIVVIDISNQKSFEHLSIWLDRIMEHSNPIKIAIFANKSDLRNREDETITSEELNYKIEQLQTSYDKYNFIISETSAITGYNIDIILSELIKMTITEKIQKEGTKPDNELINTLNKWQFNEKYHLVDGISCTNCDRIYEIDSTPSNCVYCGDGIAPYELVELYRLK